MSYAHPDTYLHYTPTCVPAGAAVCCCGTCVCCCVAGVDPAKIRIVPEGIDTTVWDPALHRPINVSKLDLRQATGPPSGPVARLKGSNGGPSLNASSSAAAAARPYSE